MSLSRNVGVIRVRWHRLNACMGRQRAHPFGTRESIEKIVRYACADSVAEVMTTLCVFGRSQPDAHARANVATQTYTDKDTHTRTYAHTTTHAHPRVCVCTYTRAHTHRSIHTDPHTHLKEWWRPKFCCRPSVAIKRRTARSCAAATSFQMTGGQPRSMCSSCFRSCCSCVSCF